MATRPARSLKHEYELYVEEEIEAYKESIPRTALLSIGDEAVSSLSAQPQFALTELLLAEEVDRIIFKRLRLPSYDAWRRRRMKLIAEMRHPEHWGLAPDDVVVRSVRPPGDARVLVAGAESTASALYLAANGCDVTAVGDEDVLDRVLAAAARAGLTERIHAQRAEWSEFTPDAQLHAVIVTAAMLRGLSASVRARLIGILQGATADGGVHLVQSIAEGRVAPSLHELESRYAGWSVSVERMVGHEGGDTFLARKALS
jgi:hypothetical protein